MFDTKCKHHKSCGYDVCHGEGGCREFQDTDDVGEADYCECNCDAEYVYNGKKFCADCLLSELESREEVKTVIVRQKQYFDHHGNYIGDSDDDYYDIISNLLNDVKSLREI